MDGILPLWKPRGMTSHDCVMKVRRLFGTKKVGHTGTLDPEVEGVLPICIGQATKIVPFLTDTTKTYVAELMLGIATETEDNQGKIIEQKNVETAPTEQEIDSVLQSFQGIITQVPPMYSAVKVNGKKLYEYARENKPVERPTRNVTIHNIKRLPSMKNDKRLISMEVVCSKGTYIRTLCVDIGRQLGYPAHMSDLVRLETGAIHKQDTVDFAMIEAAATLNNQKDLLLPIMAGLTHLDILYVDEETKRKVCFGQKLPKTKEMQTDPFVVMYEQQLLAIYQTHPNEPDRMKPVRVFNQ